MSDDNKIPPVQPPIPPPPSAPASPDLLDSMIPTKNGEALISYYLGLFSIFPFFGLFMGAVAIVKGRAGLKRVASEPGLPGKTHAYVGLGCGTVGFLFNLAIVLFILFLWFGRH